MTSATETAITSSGTTTTIGIIKFFLEAGAGAEDGVILAAPNLSSKILKTNKRPTQDYNYQATRLKSIGEILLESSSNKFFIFFSEEI